MHPRPIFPLGRRWRTSSPAPRVQLGRSLLTRRATQLHTRTHISARESQLEEREEVGVLIARLAVWPTRSLGQDFISATKVQRAIGERMWCLRRLVGPAKVGRRSQFATSFARPSAGGVLMSHLSGQDFILPRLPPDAPTTCSVRPSPTNCSKQTRTDSARQADRQSSAAHDAGQCCCCAISQPTVASPAHQKDDAENTLSVRSRTPISTCGEQKIQRPAGRPASQQGRINCNFRSANIKRKQVQVLLGRFLEASRWRRNRTNWPAES